MVAFLLGLLKVIGIVLLVILLVVLLLLAVVLFVPIRYKGNGEINDTKKEAQIKITWFLHAVSVKIHYSHPGKPVILIKVLGINIDKFTSKPKPEKKKKEKKRKGKTDIAFEKVDNAEEAVYDSSLPENAVSNNENQEPLNEEHKQFVEDYVTEKEKPKESIKDKLNKIVNKITSVYNKIKDIIENIQYYIEILQEEDTKDLLIHIFGSLFKILKSIRPRKLVVDAEIGFDTPDVTGKMYAAYWMFKPVLGEQVEIIPNFEEKIIEGEFFLKGKITVFVLAVNGLKVILNKNFKPVIKKLKNGGKKNG